MTTLTDDFNRANATGLGTSAQGWSWSASDREALNGFTCNINSNQAREASPGSVCCLRAETDLATDDNYAQKSIAVRGTGSGMGVCCRMSSGNGPSYYMAFVLDASSTIRLYKNTGGGSFTQLGSDVAITISLPQVLRVEAVGTTIKAFWDGVEKISVTDSSITTGKRSGIRTGGASGANRTFDNFESGDMQTSATIAGTESTDSAAVDGSATTGAAAAANETTDAAAIEASATTGADVVVTEWTDTASAAAEAWRTAQVSAVETTDAAAAGAETFTGAAIAANESPDAAAADAEAFARAQVAGVESADMASIDGSATTGAAVAANESTDAAAVAGGTLASISIAAVESADRVTINKIARPAFVPRKWGILLYEPLPLRKSGALGDFAEEFILAHRYGRLGRFKLRRMTDTKFFSSDHPMDLDALFVDNQKTIEWEQRTESDGAGHTWTVAELAAPAPDGAEISATGTGKRNPRTGDLIENPADIAEDIMRLAGRNDLWWDQLRAEAAAAGLRMAGSIDESLSVREWIDRVLKSAGAIWAPGMARLYPVLDVSGHVIELDKHKAKNVRVSANLSNTADILRLYYDPDKASGKSQHFIELTANPSLYGGLPADLSFDWLRTPSNAESVGMRYLPWLAGERYDVAFDAYEKIRPGQWVKLIGEPQHPEWPIESAAPRIMVLEAVIDKKTGTVACVGKTLISAPEATVTAHSVALPATRDAAIFVAIRAGALEIIARDEDEKPIPGARVNVDGGEAKTTDANGLVRFEGLAKGEHRVAIERPGKRPKLLTVLI